ncbi:unnamed protein product [Malus baccata var. baccata]
MAILQWIALILSFLAAIQGVVDGYSVDIGVNYGLLGDDLPKPREVVNLFKAYGIGKVRLFNPDPDVLWALRGQDIDVMVGVPNENLNALAESQGAVNNWFDNNIEPYLNDVNIYFITVGNEVIPGPLGNSVWQVMQYLQNILDERSYRGIKISTVLPGTALRTSFPPSKGEFNGQSSGVMTSICGFLLFRGSPLLINVYPYFAYASNPTKTPLQYALFNSSTPVQDGNLSYYNLFDATVDAFISAMERVGGAGVEVAVTESGWPSAGNGIFTSPELAGTYNRNFMKHVTSLKGTPKRPGHYIEGFIFALFNENQKPAGVEQNFGLFYPTMKPVYTVLYCKALSSDQKVMAVSQWIAFILSFLATIYNHNIEIVEAKMTFDIGVNYGTLGDNLPSHEDVVQLFKDNHINKMRLFNPNPEVLKALMGQGISIVLGIPNEDLASLSESQEAVDQWFAVNVQPYIDDIEFNYIAVGNEVIPGELGSYVWQVMQYLQHTIDEYHYQSLKVTTVLPATALGVSYPPSAGQFSGEAAGIMASICPFLNYQGSPLMINVYPYFAYASKASDIPLDYAQFTATKPWLQDGNLSYYNLFDATVDAFFSAIEKSGGPDVAVVVSESGWPSAGNGDFTDTELAGTYVRNFVRHITSNVGTPKRPGAYIEGFVFAMFNENQKPSEEEQNFGIFYPNKKPVYPVF